MKALPFFLAVISLPLPAHAVPDPYAEPPGPGMSTPATEKELADARAEYRKNHFDLTTGYRLTKALYWAGRYGDARSVVSDTSLRRGNSGHEMKEFESVFFPVAPEEQKFRAAAAALKNPGEADALLKKFVTEHPEFSAEFLAYCFNLWQQGKKAEAEAFADATLAKNPGNAGALTLKGALKIEDRKFDEAVTILKKAVELDHANAYAFQKLASLMINETKAGVAALPYLQGHIILSPGEAFPWGGRQERRLEQEREKELLGSGATPEKVRGLLGSPDGHLRRLGCGLAARNADVSQVDRLVDLLDDDSDDTRVCAAGALVRIGKTHPAEALKGKDKALASGKPFAECAALAVVAALQPEKEAVPVIAARLQHTNNTVRYEAAGILAKQEFRKNAEAKAALARFYAGEKDTHMLALRKEATSHERFERVNRAENRAYFLSSNVEKEYDTPKPLDKPYYKLAAEAEKKLAAKDLAGAEKAYIEAFAADPQEELFLGKERVLAYVNLGKVYLESGKLDEAEMLLSMAAIVGKNPERAEASYQLARVNGELEDDKGAEVKLKQMIEYTKGNAELRARLVKQAREEPRLAKLRATPEFEKALVEVVEKK